MFSGGFSLIHWLVLGVIILLLFGKGRFSDMMGDVAKGLKSFKKGLTEEEEAAKHAAEPAKRLPDGATIEVPPAAARPAEPAVPPVQPVPPADRREP